MVKKRTRFYYNLVNTEENIEIIKQLKWIKCNTYLSTCKKISEFILEKYEEIISEKTISAWIKQKFSISEQYLPYVTKMLQYFEEYKKQQKISNIMCCTFLQKIHNPF